MSADVKYKTRTMPKTRPTPPTTVMITILHFSAEHGVHEKFRVVVKFALQTEQSEHKCRKRPKSGIRFGIRKREGGQLRVYPLIL